MDDLEIFRNVDSHLKKLSKILEHFDELEFTLNMKKILIIILDIGLSHSFIGDDL